MAIAKPDRSPMIVVRKSRPGQPLTPAGEAAVEDERLLNRWYLSQMNGDRALQLNSQVAGILDHLRQRQLWIACECQQALDRPQKADGINSDLLPILCPVQLDAWGRRFSFRRIRRQIPHHPDCIFHTPDRLEDRFAFDRNLAVSSQGNPNGTQEEEYRPPATANPLKPLPASTSFALDLADGTPVHLAISCQPQRDFVTGQKRSPHPPPKLARMLFTLLEEARLHIIPPSWWKQRKQTDLRQHRLQRTQRHIVNRIPLKHYLTTQPNEIAGGCRRLETFAKAGGRDWPPHVKPQAFFAGIANGYNITAQTLQVAGPPSTLPLETPPICFAPPHSRPRGPFWAFAHIGESQLHPGRYVLRQAYVHPVFSQALPVVVDSDAERQTLEILLAVQRSLLERGLSIAITKPLHDFTTSAGEPYRPDFVLFPVRRGRGMQVGSCIVVETMGFAEQEYLERKEKTHRRMAELGEVLALDFSQKLTTDRKRDYHTIVTAACDRLMKRPILRGL